MCLASESKERGVILFDAEYIAAALKQSEAEYTAFICKLVQKGVLSLRKDGAVFFINWHSHQRDNLNKNSSNTDNPMRSEWNTMRSVVAPSIYQEYGYCCFYCGSLDKLTIDHKLPISRGGDNDFNNLVPACRSCNSRKHNKTIEEWNNE